MKRFVEFALRQPLFIWLGLALFVGGGVLAFQNLAVEAFPDVSDTQVNIIALYPGRVDRCTVDGEVVEPQPGNFYGGWITSRVTGPFKGAPGTSGW